jgi:hypothetical protein
MLELEVTGETEVQTGMDRGVGNIHKGKDGDKIQAAKHK